MEDEKKAEKVSEKISDLLKHTNVKTTETYIRSIEKIEEKDDNEK